MEIEKLHINDLQESLEQYQTKFNFSNARVKFPDGTTANIVTNSLSVDEEFSELVERNITVEENSFVHM